MPDPLPTFRYHPDPVATGAFEQQAGTCQRCGRARGWIYVVVPYAVADLRDALCPWCLADGSAAATFGATFNDVAESDGLDGVPEAVIDEIVHRTPGFSGWQQERWLFHCGDGAAFLGPVGRADLDDHPDALGALRAQVRGWGLDDDEAEAFTDALDVDGSPTAYLFRCLHCGTHVAYADSE